MQHEKVLELERKKMQWCLDLVTRFSGLGLLLLLNRRQKWSHHIIGMILLVDFFAVTDKVH